MPRNRFIAAQWLAQDGKDHERIRDLLLQSKIVQVQGDIEDVDGFYRDLIGKLGNAVPMDEDHVTGKKTGEDWIEVKYDASVKDSFRHSNTRQPLHTDGAYEANPPEYCFLYCHKEAEFGGATTFIDSFHLGETIRKHNDDLWNRLVHRYVTYSKADDNRRAKIMRMIEDEVGQIEYEMTWNYFRVDMEENDVDTIQMTSDFHNFLEDIIVPSGELTQVRLTPGSGVFFRDNRVLHGRNAFLGDRHLVKGGFNLA